MKPFRYSYQNRLYMPFFA